MKLLSLFIISNNALTRCFTSCGGAATLEEQSRSGQGQALFTQQAGRATPDSRAAQQVTFLEFGRRVRHSRYYLHF